MSNNINILNRKAKFEFEILETWTAGMQLTGGEIKSIRKGKASIAEAYCLFVKDELFLRGAHVDEYQQSGYLPQNSRRDKKLLLKRVELVKLKKRLEQDGLTIVPLKVFIADTGYAKLEIALARGKKLHDKRDSIKDRDVKRDLDRIMKR